MVAEIRENKKILFACGICKFAYETRDVAQQCENFCRAHNACSLEITKHAVRKGCQIQFESLPSDITTGWGRHDDGR